MAATSIKPEIVNQALAQAFRDLGWTPKPFTSPSSPSDLADRCWPGWLSPRHVQLVDRILVDAAAGRLKDRGYAGIIISEPPRHGKSTHCSHWFPAWFLGRYPQKNVILTSYEADFAASWGRKVRDTLQEHGKREFGVTVRADSSSASRWETTAGGGMITAGAGGAITGRGAHLLVIDDPVKNAEEAASMTIRDSVWDWYLTTARTRVEPGGFQVIIMTRWHPDDLVGRLLKQMQEDPKADRFAVVDLPALAEGDDPLGRAPGEPLWPERYDAEELERIKATLGTRAWSSLYQQRPVDAPEGTPVYETTDADGADILVVRQQSYRPGLRLFRGWDFGYRVPVCIVGQVKPHIDADGRESGETIHVLREISLPDSIVGDFGDWVVSECQRLFPGASWTDYGDPAGNQKSDKSNETSIDILRAKGIQVITRPSPVELGINIVQSLISQRKIEFDPQAKVLVSGIRSGYVRDHRGEPVGGVDGHPFTDHCDAFRYLCLHLFHVKGQQSSHAVRPQTMAERDRQVAPSQARYTPPPAHAGQMPTRAHRPRLNYG
jgi:hypothetical protein